MKERPILFSAPMVRALLDGTKTQTRREAKKPVRHPDLGNLYTAGALVMEHEPRHVIERACPYGQPGDRLWVRETWQGPLLPPDDWEEHCNDAPDELPAKFRTPAFCQYAADGGPAPEFMTSDDELVCRWRPSIHMPRWASRVTLEITSVRVERLQDISEDDAQAEGVTECDGLLDEVKLCGRAKLLGIPATECRVWFAELWESINGPESWDANPWVWVLEFKRVTPCN